MQMSHQIAGNARHAAQQAIEGLTAEIPLEVKLLPVWLQQLPRHQRPGSRR